MFIGYIRKKYFGFRQLLLDLLLSPSPLSSSSRLPVTMDFITIALISSLDQGLCALQDLVDSSPGSMAEPSDWETWGRNWVVAKVRCPSVYAGMGAHILTGLV